MNEDEKKPDVTPETFPTANAAKSVFAGMPEYLKDPANFERIQRAIFEAGASTCGHSELIEWSGCWKCQMKQKDRSEMIQRLGFRSPAQYLAWVKVHTVIKERVPLR